ncbi:MAG: hypothetical protein AAFO89_02135, partial [Planctomycetota bacterium]
MPVTVNARRGQEHSLIPRFARCACLLASSLAACQAATQEKLHFTYLWHLEQPIYWPDQKV